MEILKVNGLSFKYALGTETVLHDISFSADEGDFIVVSGPTGCGKSTLLRMLKRELRPNGKFDGSIFFRGVPAEDMDDITAAAAIGYVMQRPEQQIVTDKVWHELAFGLENMNVPQEIIRRRVSEMAAYFGIEDWFEMSVDELSGGQKQLLNLASVMVMQPSLLILDEPTSQLDPIAASDFLAAVKKLNQEMGLTVILVEHRLEEAVPMANKLMIMDRGRLLLCGAPSAVCSGLAGRPDLLEAMPVCVRLFNRFQTGGSCPLSVLEARRWIENNFRNDIRSIEVPVPKTPAAPALKMEDVWFRYGRKLADVLCGCTLTAYEGEILCILGGNGSGKTTALSVAAGLNKAYSGKTEIFGKDIKEYKNGALYDSCLALLPQDVQTVFMKNTVREELKDAAEGESMLPFSLKELYDQHPYDLSGGQQQMVALAKVLSAKPRLLLLDEPTKGIDAHAVNGLIDVLHSLKEQGMSIVIVTHDVEFAALAADRCALFFRGNVSSCGYPNEFFSGNSFYTTAANRMTRWYYYNCVTEADVIQICRGQRKTSEPDIWSGQRKTSEPDIC